MDRREVQRKLVASETFCFAGARDFPKVYETLTRHHVEPVGSISGQLSSYAHPDPDADAYKVVLDLKSGDITVTALRDE
ncbi:hypothetical protein [Nocardioides panacisoli]|uniref:Uncharacterized protein n=1 Tax=Nocardioides panacisoli TaxID=627624 RepID=A0ABP7J325_9ACTN